MVDAGCTSVKMGIESGSPRILEYINKHETVEKYKQAAKLLNDQKLSWTAYLMVGFPTEEIEDVELTKQLVEEMKPTYASVGVFTPYPGTELFSRMNIDRIYWQYYNHHNITSHAGNLSSSELFEVFHWADVYNII